MCWRRLVPADRLPKSQALDWSAPVVAGAAQLAAVTAERDQLRAERVPLTDVAALAVIDDMGWDLDSIEQADMMRLARAVEAAHGIKVHPTP